MPTKPVPPPYPPELRARLMDLVRAGQTPEELARKFEPTAQSIRNWIRQADLDAGTRTDGLEILKNDLVRPAGEYTIFVLP